MHAPSIGPDKHRSTTDINLKLVKIQWKGKQQKSRYFGIAKLTGKDSRKDKKEDRKKEMEDRKKEKGGRKKEKGGKKK